MFRLSGGVCIAIVTSMACPVEKDLGLLMVDTKYLKEQCPLRCLEVKIKYCYACNILSLTKIDIKFLSCC